MYEGTLRSGPITKYAYRESVLIEERAYRETRLYLVIIFQQTLNLPQFSLPILAHIEYFSLKFYNKFVKIGGV